MVKWYNLILCKLYYEMKLNTSFSFRTLTHFFLVMQWPLKRFVKCLSKNTLHYNKSEYYESHRLFNFLCQNQIKTNILWQY